MLVSHRKYDVFIDEAQFFVNLVPFVNVFARGARGARTV